MSQRTAGMTGDTGQFTLPRGWIILGLGAASWLAVVGVMTIATTAFQAISAAM